MKTDGAFYNQKETREKICWGSGKALGGLAYIFPCVGLANIQFCQEALGNSPFGVTSLEDHQRDGYADTHV